MVANFRYKHDAGLSAKALVLDFLSVRSPREVSAQVLVAAGTTFGFSGQNIRMALSRLVEQSVAINSGRGQYRLSTSGRAMREEVRKWRRVAELTRPWSGAWIGIYEAAVPRADRGALRRHERAMRLRGFRRFLDGLWLRPANLNGSMDQLRRHLRVLGLHPEALVVGLSDLDAAARAKATRLWDTASLLASYRALGNALRASESKLDRMSLEAAAAEVLTLGREVIRHINLDPLLPDELMAQRPLRALVGAMSEYDARGREIWWRFMRILARRC